MVSEQAHTAIMAADPKMNAADLLPVVQNLATELALYAAYGQKIGAQ